MGIVESNILAYIKDRLEAGVLSVNEAEIMEAVVPPDHPEFRMRPAYRHGLDRLRRRHIINAVADQTGTLHYFIGNYASAALRQSLGI
jgi:putative heme degradation protein